MEGGSSKWQCPFDEKAIKEIYQNYDHQKFLLWLQHPVVNYSLGCMFGSFIGDALGSYLEFSATINSDLVEEAMTMRAGGPFNLRAGQVTDDSEMSFHLLASLSHYDPLQLLQAQRPKLIRDIAQGYVAWKNSKPFDIGNTCRSSIQVLQQQLRTTWKGSDLEKQKQQVNKKLMEVNSKSQSNGSLMRITPLAFLACCHLYLKKKNEHFSEMEKFIEDQVRLIHPHENIIRSSVQWVKTLYLLSIRKNNQELKQVYRGSLSEANKRINKDWAAEIKAQKPMPANNHQGWAKIAWSYGMRELKNAVDIYSQNSSYKFDDFYYQEVIRRVLARGGDTDTNAAIVGGMIGAIVGFKNLPGKYLRKMMELDFSKKEKGPRNDRNRFYEPRSAFVMIYQFLQKLYQTKQKVPDAKC